MRGEERIGEKQHEKRREDNKQKREETIRGKRRRDKNRRDDLIISYNARQHIREEQINTKASADMSIEEKIG